LSILCGFVAWYCSPGLIIHLNKESDLIQSESEGIQSLARDA
jgi:hypothetical protein